MYFANPWDDVTDLSASERDGEVSSSPSEDNTDEWHAPADTSTIPGNARVMTAIQSQSVVSLPLLTK